MAKPEEWERIPEGFIVVTASNRRTRKGVRPVKRHERRQDKRSRNRNLYGDLIPMAPWYPPAELDRQRRLQDDIDAVAEGRVNPQASVEAAVGDSEYIPYEAEGIRRYMDEQHERLRRRSGRRLRGGR